MSHKTTNNKFNNDLFNLYPSSIIPFIIDGINPFKDKIESFHIKFDENDMKGGDSVFKLTISRYNFKYNMEYSTGKNVADTAAFVGTYVPPPDNENEYIFKDFRPIYIILDMDESTIGKITTIFKSNKPRKLQTDKDCDLTNAKLKEKQEKECDFIRCKFVYDTNKEVQANYYFYICFTNNMIDIANSYLVNKVVTSTSMFSNKKRCRNIIGKVTMGLLTSDAPLTTTDSQVSHLKSNVDSPRYKPLPPLPPSSKKPDTRFLPDSDQLSSNPQISGMSSEIELSTTNESQSTPPSTSVSNGPPPPPPIKTQDEIAADMKQSYRGQSSPKSTQQSVSTKPTPNPKR